MRAIYRHLSIGLLVTLLSATVSIAQENIGGDREKYWIKNDRGHLIFFAVLEGLYKDGVSDEVVANIIPPSESEGRHDLGANFVFACPLCEPAFEAFRLYSARPDVQRAKKLLDSPTVTFGDGLPAGIKEELLSDDDSIRRPALQALIQEWIARYVDRMRLSDEELAELSRRMEEGRKEGMAFLNNKDVMPDTDWENCAACDAATGACTRPGKADETESMNSTN